MRQGALFTVIHMEGTPAPFGFHLIGPSDVTGPVFTLNDLTF